MTIACKGFGVQTKGSKFEKLSYDVREPGDHDVVVEVHFCGICHSDIHCVKGEWSRSVYPCVPGHEFTGKVVRIGSKVTKRKVGDRVAVGCLLDSCGNCEACKCDREQFCDSNLPTYNGTAPDGSKTKGGYGQYIVANERWVFNLPDSLPMDKAAPLTCAGITTFTPVRKYTSKGGLNVAVVGLGGLGHMAIQWAVAYKNDVTVITRAGPKQDLAKKLGAKHVFTNEDVINGTLKGEQFDYMIDTCPAHRDVEHFQKLIDLLKFDSTYTLVGLPPVGVDNVVVKTEKLVCRGKAVGGSLIGGIQQTQDMLDFAGKHVILPLCEMVDTNKIDETYEKVEAGKILFRAVMNIKDGIQ